MESKGIQALSTVIRQPQNARVLHKALLKNYDENSDPYNMALSQVIGDILEGRSLKDVLTGIKSGKTAWSHESFDISSGSSLNRTISLRIHLRSRKVFLNVSVEVREYSRTVSKHGGQTSQ